MGLIIWRQLSRTGVHIAMFIQASIIILTVTAINQRMGKKSKNDIRFKF